MSETPLKSSTGDPRGPGGATNASQRSDLFSSSQSTNFRPITDLWTGQLRPEASTVVQECLSCDRWAGTTVIIGGFYLLWNTRRAPSTASKWLVGAAGSLMVTGGAYQGFIHNYFKVHFGDLLRQQLFNVPSALRLSTDHPLFIVDFRRNIEAGLQFDQDT